ncbi:glycosyl transferase family 2 [Cricetibacter osteomyelitidis]|uniref:Glycosyl transferase family 2 n=1 Tax=Cricetibacter osteomyelitidis TaxID=1521931 RepID=A0A4R2SPF8_9PAST|nr:glycosyltransferase [Cricetibacter osteomyelitidis]TCP90096.1 glycosyl transferase family 2 [Cricetibacter osteomyelitidis]
MKFSVLMSLYIKEQPQFLTECFESLLAQIVRADEIVLVFDGQITAELQAVVTQYQNQLPIRIIPLERNVGLGKALNEGIKHCRNEWIFRMDTDDICHPKRFAKQVAFIEQHPEVDIFSTWLVEFENDISQLKGERKVPVQADEIKRYAQLRSPFNHPSVAYRKSMLEKVGGYQHHLFLEDYNLWLRIIAQGYNVANMPEVLLYMRVGNGMVKRRKGWTYFKSEWQLAQLKYQLKLTNCAIIFSHFLLRGLPRLLPTGLLTVIYNRLHK